MTEYNPYQPPSSAAYPPPQPAQQPSPAGALRPSYPPIYSTPREHPQGTTVLVLGILGLMVGLCGPAAWWMGNKALREIRSSGVVYANEQQIVVGRILGIAASILLMISVVFIVVLIGILAITAAMGSA
jgi:hypothetical protein